MSSRSRHFPWYNPAMQNLLNRLKTQNPDLKEAEIEGLLYIIRSRSALSSALLMELTGLSKEVLRAFKSSISYLLMDKPELELNKKGTLLLQESSLRPYAWSLLSYINTAAAESFLEIRKKYALVPKRAYDQFFATPQTSINKAMLMMEKGVVKGRRIALLGDDDFVAIALNLVGAGAKEIVVFDVDEAILQTIASICIALGYKNIKTVLCDLRKGLPRGYLHSFDGALTDPPYTASGVALFLNRCIELLEPPRDFSGSYVFLACANSLRSPQKTLELQKIIADFNLVIEDKIAKFNRYVGAETVGNASSMYVLKLTPKTKSIKLGDLTGIYTNASF